MGLNKKEEEILKQIEQELMKDDPDLAKTVEDSTLSKFTRNRAVISFFVFVIGLLTMFSTYIILPAIAISASLSWLFLVMFLYIILAHF